MTPLAYRPKSDVLFKMLFTRNEHLLRSFVSAALGIPAGDIKNLVIKNTEILPDKASGKFCRLDLHLTMEGGCMPARLTWGMITPEASRRY